MKNTKLKGNLMLLLTAFIWGTSFIAQSIGVNSISPFTFIGIRSLLGGLVLLPVIYILDMGKKKRNQPVIKFDKKLLAGGISCGIILCAASTLQTAGMIYTSPGKSGFITALYMVIVPIIGLFMGKKISLPIVAAVIGAVIGMYLLCIDSAFSINKGDVLTLLCAFIFSAHILVIDYFSPQTDGIKLSCLQFFVCGIAATLIAVIFERPAVAPIIESWIPLCYSGFLSCGVAYTLQVVGQKYTDPTSASILMSLESVFATLSTVVLVALGWNLTGGTLSPREIAGCVLMFISIMLVQLPDMKNRSKASPLSAD